MESQVQVVQAFGMPAGTEWLIVLVVALLLFGRRLPEVMRGLGGSIREFKKGMDVDAPLPPVEPAKPIDGAVSRPVEPPPATPDDRHT